MGIKFTVYMDVKPCSLVEMLHASKQSYIFIFDFIISLYGDIGMYSFHKAHVVVAVVVVVAVITVKVIVNVDYCIC